MKGVTNKIKVCQRRKHLVCTHIIKRHYFLKVFVQFSGRIGSIGSLNCIVSATLTVDHHFIVIVGTDRL